MPSKYMQLADALRKTLKQHITDIHYRLPTEMELCRTYGVSRQTVRHALSILEKEGTIVKRQGSGSYPSPSLAASSDRIAAVILPDSKAYLHSAALRDIQALFSEHHFTVRIFITDYLFEREREILQSLLNEPVCALLAQKVCTACPNPNDDLYKQLAEMGIPIAFWNSGPEIPGTFHVCPDDFQGGYQLTSYLIEHHHQNIAGIFQIEELESHQKFLGCIKALHSHGLMPETGNFYWYSSFTYPPAKTAPEPSSFPVDFLTRISQNCSAVLCHNDEAAYALIRALLQQGISVPGDLAVVSFDDSYLSELSPVRITSMACRKEKPWTSAAGFLLQRCRDSNALPDKLFWQLHKKDSD